MLRLEHISKTFHPGTVNEKRALNDLSLHLKEGDFCTVIGGNGAGKSTLLNAVAGVWPVDCGTITIDGQNVTGLPEYRRAALLGRVFQDPMTSLNPLMTIGGQIADMYRFHTGASKKEAMEKAQEMLAKVGIEPAAKRCRQYPFELSGGMQQRVMIAMAIACAPKLLIADEPTTALDVTIQAQILELLQQLSQDMGMSILLITHNFGVVAETCQRTSVMYAGKVVETGETRELLRSARHPYSRALIRSIPGGGARGSRLETIPGSPPALFEPPASCMFAPRCPYADETCRTGYPAMADCGDGHLAACFKPLTEEVSAHV